MSEEVLKTAMKEAKDRGEKERYMEHSKEWQGEIRKLSSVNNAKKERKTIKWERLEISSRRIEIPRKYFIQRWAQ